MRRRHNYFPFILNLIGVLGKENLLRNLTEKAKEKKKEKIKRIEEEQKKREEKEKKDKENKEKKDESTKTENKPTDSK